MPRIRRRLLTIMQTRRALVRDDRGSAPVEFVLVAALLTALTLSVLQFGLAIYVRNVVHDAAVEGAHVAALADNDPTAGAARTREIITRTVGAAYAESVTVRTSTQLGHPSVQVTVSTTLPLLGLLGVARGMEVTAHAPRESLD